MKFTFISEGQVTDVYEASSKDDLVNNFTPDAFKNLVEVPDNAEHGMLFDGTNITANTPPDDRTDAEKARDIECAKPENILKREEDYFDYGLTPLLPDSIKNNATALAAERAKYLEEFQIS